jgi:hypothetical protein
MAFNDAPARLEPHRNSRRTAMNRTMKLLAVLAFATATAAPAFAQQAPSARRDAADTPQWSRQTSNNNANPDFQLGGDR